MVSADLLPTIQAREQWLLNLERGWLDAHFAAMESDEVYRALQLAIVEEFASSDRETWRLC